MHPAAPPSGRPIAGLIKFFARPEYLEDLLKGRLYCNTPQFYRDHPAPGVADDFEACVSYYSKHKHKRLPTIVIDGVQRDVSQAETLMVYHDADKHDAHLQCWCALERPMTFEVGVAALKQDLARLQQEAGPLYVFLPAKNVTAYGALLDDATTGGWVGNFVDYTDDWKRRGMFGKRASFAYQREYRFAIGRLEKGHLVPRVFEGKPTEDLLEVCPTIWFSNAGQKVAVLSPGTGSE